MIGFDDHTGITVTGTGEVTAPPDLMIVDLGVSIRGDSVTGASSSASERAAALISALRGHGITAADILTTRFSIHPEYDHSDGEQRLLGFRVTNTVRVTIRDLANAGALLDAAVRAGRDGATVDNIAFSVEDDRALEDSARQAAWGDALARAEHMARLAGRTLGAVVSIVESSGRPPVPYPLARMAAMAEATPIEPGAASVRVTLEVRFELR